MGFGRSHQYIICRDRYIDIAQLEIKVQSGSSQNEVSSFEEGILNVRGNRPPYRGNAKDENITLVSNFLGVPQNVYLEHIAQKEGLKFWRSITFLKLIYAHV